MVRGGGRPEPASLQGDFRDSSQVVLLPQHPVSFSGVPAHRRGQGDDHGAHPTAPLDGCAVRCPSRLRNRRSFRIAGRLTAATDRERGCQPHPGHLARHTTSAAGLGSDASAGRREARRSNGMTATLLSGPDQKAGLSLAHVKGSGGARGILDGGSGARPGKRRCAERGGRAASSGPRPATEGNGGFRAHRDRAPVVLASDLERTGQRWRLLNPHVEDLLRDDEHESDA